MLTRTPRPLSDRARGLGRPSCECGNKDLCGVNVFRMITVRRVSLCGASPLCAACSCAFSRARGLIYAGLEFSARLVLAAGKAYTRPGLSRHD